MYQIICEILGNHVKPWMKHKILFKNLFVRPNPFWFVRLLKNVFLQLLIFQMWWSSIIKCKAVVWIILWIINLRHSFVETSSQIKPRCYADGKSTSRSFAIMRHPRTLHFPLWIPPRRKTTLVKLARPLWTRFALPSDSYATTEPLERMAYQLGMRALRQTADLEQLRVPSLGSPRQPALLPHCSLYNIKAPT